MATVRSHRELLVWQKAVELCIAVYKLTKSFPISERFGLTSQLRRASVSVPSNIAEGYGRGSTADYLRFLRAARGSLLEVDTQLCIARRLELAPEKEFSPPDGLQNEVSKMLAALIRSLEQSQSS